MTILVQYRDNNRYAWTTHKFLDSELVRAEDHYRQVLSCWEEVQIVLTEEQDVDSVILIHSDSEAEEVDP